MTHPSERWQSRQHGVVAASQLADLGLTRTAVAKRVTAGRLHPLYRGVYAVGHRRVSQEGALAGGGAGGRRGRGAQSPERRHPLERVAPKHDRGSTSSHRADTARGPGSGSGRCRHLDPRDITTHDGIPVTTVPRTLVDLTDVLDARRLANVLHEAAFHRRFNMAATRAAMSRAAGRRNLGVLETALAAHEAGSAGTRSALEDRVLALVALGRDPRAARQRADPSGRAGASRWTSSGRRSGWSSRSTVTATPGRGPAATTTRGTVPSAPPATRSSGSRAATSTTGGGRDGAGRAQPETLMVPTMPGWIVHSYLTVPALSSLVS